MKIALPITLSLLTKIKDWCTESNMKIVGFYLFFFLNRLIVFFNGKRDGR